MRTPRSATLSIRIRVAERSRGRCHAARQLGQRAAPAPQAVCRTSVTAYAHPTRALTAGHPVERSQGQEWLSKTDRGLVQGGDSLLRFGARQLIARFGVGRRDIKVHGVEDRSPSVSDFVLTAVLNKNERARSQGQSFRA